jgi:hypothetical protein
MMEPRVRSPCQGCVLNVYVITATELRFGAEKASPPP